MILDIKTMDNPGCSKSDSTCVFQVMVFCITGTVARVFPIEKKNYIVVGAFDY